MLTHDSCLLFGNYLQKYSHVSTFANIQVCECGLMSADAQSDPAHYPLLPPAEATSHLSRRRSLAYLRDLINGPLILIGTCCPISVSAFQLGSCVLWLPTPAKH